MGANSESWRKLEEAFEGALDLTDTSARLAYLKQALANDPVLLAEADAMLRAHENLEPLAIEKWLLRAQEQEPDLSGTLIGTYRLVRLIARGGMGEVYAAEREGGAFRQQVALKLVRSGLIGMDGLLRFRQERQILARLTHPQIVPLIDGGVTTDGRPYLVLQYVDGQPITAYCDAHDSSIEERLRLFQDVGRAVEHAHRNLIVHRDLKPSNILVTADGQVRLLDFGVAKMLEPPPDEETLVTRVESRVMTPEYAAPEQVRGTAITTTTDVYALGALLYELMTGARPFTTGAGGRRELEQRILDEEPLPPSVAARQTKGRRWSKRLRGDLDTIVRKALAKEPEHRYSSAESLVRDVERFLAGDAVVAQRPSVAYRLTKFARRNRLATAVAVVSLALLLGLTGMIWYQSIRVANERDVARTEQEKANRVVSLLVDLFATVNPEVQPRGQDLTLGEFLKKIEGAVVEQKDVDPEVQARVRHTLGKMYMARSQYSEARTHFDAALDLLRKTKGERNPATAEVQHDIATLVARTRPAEAEPLLRQSLALNRQIYGDNHESVAQCMQELGEVVKDDSEMRTLLEGALAIRRRLASRPDRGVAASLNSLGVYHYSHRAYRQAEHEFEEALTILQHLMPGGHPAILSVMGNLSVTRSNAGQWSEAVDAERSLLDERLRVLGEESEAVGNSYGNLGVALANLGKLEESEQSFRKSLALYSKLLGPGHLLTINAMRNVGRIRLLRGDPSEAFRMLEAATVARKGTALNAGYWHLVGQRAVAEAELGRREEAIGKLRVALQNLVSLYGENREYVADTQIALGFLLLQRGDAGEAETLVREALETRQSVLAPAHPGIAEAECALGIALSMQGKAGGREQIGRNLSKYRTWGLSLPAYVDMSARFLK